MTLDPGWIPARETVGNPVARSHLTRFRFVYLAFVVALVVIGPLMVVTYGLERPGGVTEDATALVLGLVGIAIIFFYGVMAVVRRTLLRSLTPERFLALYPTLMFLTLAFAESIPMAGFVLSVLSGSAWPYLVGLVFAVPGLVIAAPTKRNLERLRDDYVPGIDIFGVFVVTEGGGTTA